MSWKDGRVRRSLSEAFLSTVKVSLEDSHMFYFCCTLFCSLVNGYDLDTEHNYYREEDRIMVEAESNGVVFIKNRKADKMDQVQPRVSLPYLFSAAPAIWRQQQEQQQISEVDTFYRLNGTEGKLDQLLPVLLTNIGIALNGLVSDLPTAFELIMLYVELFRVYVFFSP